MEANKGMKDHIAFVERLAREAVLIGGIWGGEGVGGGAGSN